MKKILSTFLIIILGMLFANFNEAKAAENETKTYIVKFEFPDVTEKNLKELKKQSEKTIEKIEKYSTILKTYDNFPFILIKMDDINLEKIRKIEGIISVNENTELNVKSTGYSGISQYCSICDNSYLTDTLAQALINQGFTGKGTQVAVMDTGVLSTHQELNLKQEVNCGWLSCTDSTGDRPYETHGTGVAGIIGSQGIKTRGIAPGADLYSIKFGGEDITGDWVSSSSDFIEGIEWAINNGIDIINMSFTMDETSETNDVITNAYSRGILLIAGAGNTGSEGVNYPARHGYVLAISNFDTDINKLYYTSTYGLGIDFTAPGVAIYIPDFNSNQAYGFNNGTSFSAPMVTGIASLLREKYSSTNSDIKNSNLIDYMVFMAKNVNTPEYGTAKNKWVGNGLIQGEIGNSIDKQITINQTYYLHNMPSDNYKLSLSVNPQTLRAIRQYKDWYEIKTWVGPRWIKPLYYYGEFKITLIQDTTTLHDEPNGSPTGYSLSSQTVTGIQRYGDWFEIKTWLGNKWIKPYYYSF